MTNGKNSKPPGENDGDDDGSSFAKLQRQHRALDIDLVSPPGDSVRLDSCAFQPPQLMARGAGRSPGKIFLHYSGYYMDGVHRYGWFRTFSYFRTLLRAFNS